MSNPKIINLRKSDHHQYYCIEKTQEFFTVFRKILKKLQFSFHDVEGFGRPQGSDGEFIADREENIKNYNNIHTYLENDTYNLDLIFSREKIHLIINSRTNTQEISKIINEHFDIK